MAATQRGPLIRSQKLLQRAHSSVPKFGYIPVDARIVPDTDRLGCCVTNDTIYGYIDKGSLVVRQPKKHNKQLHYSIIFHPI